jgi:hypothetical protein
MTDLLLRRADFRRRNYLHVVTRLYRNGFIFWIVIVTVPFTAARLYETQKPWAS